MRNVLGGRIELVTSPEIDLEYYRASLKPGVPELFARRGVHVSSYIQVIDAVGRVATHVEPTGEAPPCRDESDRKYLHCAKTGNVDFLITYDRDLLESDGDIAASVVTPSAAINGMRAARVSLID